MSGKAPAHDGDAEARQLAETVARRGYGKLIAFLAARSRDVAAAEDALSDAFAAALATWPVRGCPANPEAWLLTAARRGIIDSARKRSTADSASAQLSAITEGMTAMIPDGGIPDRRLALMFACAHPAIDVGVRAALMLQLMLGVDAAAIASVFLTSPAAMSKRLVRAKTKIRDAGIPFDIPAREELPARLESILDAIYAAFGHGWTDPGAIDGTRTDIIEEALYLAELVAELLPEEPEALGLFALILLLHARRRARRDPRGNYIPLTQQNPASWDLGMMARAQNLLMRASRLSPIGRFQLEAVIQSTHVDRILNGSDNWSDVAQLYDALLDMTESPVVAINRALVVAELSGPEAGLAAMPSTEADSRLVDYQPYWAARAELLARNGDVTAASDAYDLAIGLERDAAVRRYLVERKLEMRRPT